MGSGVARGGAEEATAPHQATKKVFVEKFIKIPKVCRIIEEYFRVSPPNQKIFATPLGGLKVP